MGVEALTLRDDGSVARPSSEQDWLRWVSATQTRNHVLGDPILDWLHLYGEAHGFSQDTTLPQYDARTDFTEFIFEQARRFEEAVVSLLEKNHSVVTIASAPGDARSLEKANDTFDAMVGGVPIIIQGVLLNPEHETYGIPDLLIRSDELAKLFPGSIEPEEISKAAPDLPGASWHYRVVDIKFRMLGLLVGGELDNSGSAPAYKLQLFVYNQALGRIQGFEPATSYLLGRGWTQREDRGSNCLERLAPVGQAGTVANNRPISDAVTEALRWIRDVRTEGVNWKIFPQPSVSELYPNNSNNEDGPWHYAKKQITEHLEDLTMLWRVAVQGRRKGHEVGIYKWTDPRVTAELVDVTGEKRSTMFDKLLAINKTVNEPAVQPLKIQAYREEWHDAPELEFYVDFETVSDLADDLSQLPEKGGQPLIFMIGCGHVEDGEWHFESFVVDALSESAEAVIIQRWFIHMETVRSRLAPTTKTSRIIHWSPAEVINLETAYNSAKERHNRPDWSSLGWFDFLRKVIHEEPVVVRGSMAFGLKPVAKAMHSHGLIDTLWGDGPTDGRGAMVGAWWCAQEARRLGVGMQQIALMQDIANYNEVDCKVMMEIVGYLRHGH